MTDIQAPEIPRAEWANIKPGSRVRLVDGHEGDVFETTVKASDSETIDFGRYYAVDADVIDRIFLLAEPADPDADLIERMAGTIGGKFSCSGEPVVSEVYRDVARAVLVVVRQSEAVTA